MSRGNVRDVARGREVSAGPLDDRGPARDSGWGSIAPWKPLVVDNVSEELSRDIRVLTARLPDLLVSETRRADQRGHCTMNREDRRG